MPIYRYQVVSTGILDNILSKYVDGAYNVLSILGPTMVDISADAAQKDDLDTAMKSLGLSEVFIVDPANSSGVPIIAVGDNTMHSVVRWNGDNISVLDSLTNLDNSGNLAISGIYKIGQDALNINHLSDVNTVGATSGEVLKFNGSLWTPQEDLTGGGSDTDAIHDNVANEIALITEKTSPVDIDIIIIEDSAASNAKKKVLFQNFPGSSAAKGRTWTFSTTTTDSDPGTGFMRLNNATQASATQAFIDNVAFGGVTLSAVLLDLKINDHIYFQESATANRYHLYRVTGNATDGTGYVKVPITSVSAGSAIRNNKKVTAFIFKTDKDAIHDNVSGEISALTEKVSPTSSDLLIIEDAAASNAKKKVQIGNLPAGNGGGSKDTLEWVLNGKMTVQTKIDGSRSVFSSGTITGVSFVREKAGNTVSGVIDVNIGGTTIFTTQANRPFVLASAGDNAVSQKIPNVTSFAKQDIFTVDIDEVETGNPLHCSVIVEVSYT